jgi:hypothetical protein
MSENELPQNAESERPLDRTRQRPGPSRRKVALVFFAIAAAVCLAYVVLMTLLLSRS